VFYECVALDTEIRVLFSGATWKQFSDLKTIVMMKSGITHDDQPLTLDAFTNARNKTMAALYSEIGLAAPDAVAHVAE
jgi:hypothetical protein